MYVADRVLDLANTSVFFSSYLKELINFRQKLVKIKLYSIFPIQVYSQQFCVNRPLCHLCISELRNPARSCQNWFGIARSTLQNMERGKERKLRANDFPFKGHDPEVACLELANCQSHGHLHFKAGWEMQSPGQPCILLVKN